jgi:hypothetical protein
MHGKRAVVLMMGIWSLFIRETHAIDTHSVLCKTDRETYRQGDEVTVTITNNSNDGLTIADRNYIDGGFASIEMKHADGTWHAIELYAAANIINARTLKKGESHRYVWKTIGYNRSDTVAGLGAHRIKLQNELISNEFIITDGTHSR